MALILTNLYRTIAAGVILAIVLFAIVAIMAGGNIFEKLADRNVLAYIFVWMHVASGVMWIGHLWYFNFTQMVAMPKIPAEQKPAVSKFIAPEALWWFRWGAMATIVTGLIVAWLRGYVDQALTLGVISKDPSFPISTFLIGVGMWLGIIMWFNVWFIIWPNQKKALNLNNAYADLPQPAKDRAARLAMLFSRTNTLLSIPMLLAMTGGGSNFNASALL